MKMANCVLVIGNKNYSSWSLRAWLALKRTGIDFQEILVPLMRPETKAAILAHSPSGKVPLLRLGDDQVWDSLSIAETLAERFPAAGLWPAAATARATARSVSAEMHAGFMALRRALPMNLRAHLPGRPRAADAEADIARVQDIWTSCRTRFGAAGPFLFGGFTIADAFYAPVVGRFRTYDVALTDVCQAYADAVWQTPDMQAWVAAAVAEGQRIAEYEA
ncbi:glutathione S-transferase family protein [Shumkonia mesophila]|uniref:glutathione S-transferase family protein n=1 Tax=Shumkonia mesophila TaxID=2838854 RepID=UPI002934720A|nr:glutathione S-transferase family protein [Shumkonia mesophila]